MTDARETGDEVDALLDRMDALREEVRRRFVGQDAVLEQVLACILADGNALLEGKPGLGKTLLVRTVAEVTDLEFARIQNTPDLMPSDITGTEIVREGERGREFVFERGPVFANVVLADEINRATPKTQAALLEAMQERQVTVSGETYDLPEPFFVLATQNPIEQEGTYPLPEAQSDRFLLKVTVSPPDRDEELAIVDRYVGRENPTIDVDPVLGRDELRRTQRYVRQVPVARDLTEWAVDLVRATRHSEALAYGASPRASMGLLRMAKARAFLHGETHVSETDIEAMARPVLRHRVGLDYEAEREGLTPDDVIERVLSSA